MFLKSKKPAKLAARKKEAIPSIITRDMNVLGNIVSEGVIDIEGTIDGNIRCDSLTVRPHGFINGEIVANNVFIYGKVKGLIRAKSVHLYASCYIEGIIMHESIAIEDGAFIDGKCKRTDKIQADDGMMKRLFDTSESEDDASGELKILENIRLIR
jgi:cytoskeletal protein CcmA (bactofilin family)